MARPFMPLAGLLLLGASGGCSGGYGPGPDTNDGGPSHGPDRLDLDAWRTISDAHPTDSACSGLRMQCGAAAATVHATPGTCTYQLPCELLGADRLHVVTGNIELPMDGVNGWSYANVDGTAVAINGPLCTDVMNGATVDLMISGACGPIN
jgi:hypothetical protein